MPLVGLAPKEADLPGLGHLRFPQAFVALRAGHAIPQRALELHRQMAVVVAVRSVLVERLAGRTEAGAGLRVVVEVLGPVVLGAFLRVSMCL